MPVRVGINGFGRIGRLTLRTILQNHPGNIDVVAVNDLTDVKTNAHLFKYDSTYGPFAGTVRCLEWRAALLRHVRRPHRPAALIDHGAWRPDDPLG